MKRYCSAFVGFIAIVSTSALGGEAETNLPSDSELKAMQRELESRCVRNYYQTPWEEIDIDMKKASALLRQKGLPSTCKEISEYHTELEALQRKKDAAIELARLEVIERNKLEEIKLEAQRQVEKKERLAKEAPNFLRKLETMEFCQYYGQSMRGESIDEMGSYKNPHELFKKEASRRKLKFSAKLIKEQKVRIGMSLCDLYASWGYPDAENRTVGGWGVHIQHVYGDFGPYVYTENGRVSSWQD